MPASQFGFARVRSMLASPCVCVCVSLFCRCRISDHVAVEKENIATGVTLLSSMSILHSVDETVGNRVVAAVVAVIVVAVVVVLVVVTLQTPASHNKRCETGSSAGQRSERKSREIISWSYFR